jgi:hypothetical protein
MRVMCRPLTICVFIKAANFLKEQLQHIFVDLNRVLQLVLVAGVSNEELEMMLTLLYPCAAKSNTTIVAWGNHLLPRRFTGKPNFGLEGNSESLLKGVVLHYCIEKWILEKGN